LNHRSFIDFTEWAIDTTGIGKDEVIGSLSPVVFDIYCFELCLLMSLGSTIVLIREHLSAFPARILELLISNKATYLFWVPTIMVNIANMGLLERLPLPALRNVWFAGEVFPTKQFNIWRKNLPNARFINLYGPIEITLDCTYYIAGRELNDDEPIPIGFPCRNTDILILGDDDEAAGQGEDGELCVRGTSLAMGYYNDPEKTASVFVQNPLNTAYPERIYRTGDIVSVNESGEILFKGRKDTLIKHSGYRIELGEVEHVLINNLRLVRNGAAVYNYDKKEIVFFYENDALLELGRFRKQASEALPKYMIPARLIRLDEMPRNVNGKIDRISLAAMISGNG
jgi:acyl-coenzyme A synthetase/AMP-(fatty) acid ligase